MKGKIKSWWRGKRREITQFGHGRKKGREEKIQEGGGGGEEEVGRKGREE